MKSALTIFLIFSFLGIAVFGFFAMNHGDHGHGCIAAMAQGSDCADKENTFSYVTFHLDSFRNFFTAVFGDNTGSLLLLFSFLLICGAAIAHRFRLNSLANKFSSQFAEPSAHPFERQLIRWLALLENSPSAL